MLSHKNCWELAPGAGHGGYLVGTCCVVRHLKADMEPKRFLFLENSHRGKSILSREQPMKPAVSFLGLASQHRPTAGVGGERGSRN